MLETSGHAHSGALIWETVPQCRQFRATFQIEPAQQRQLRGVYNLLPCSKVALLAVHVGLTTLLHMRFSQEAGTGVS
jgi:hypothetical protein